MSALPPGCMGYFDVQMAHYEPSSKIATVDDESTFHRRMIKSAARLIGYGAGCRLYIHMQTNGVKRPMWKVYVMDKIILDMDDEWDGIILL